MASPGSYGSSYSSSFGGNSLGAQNPRPQLSLETTIDRCWQFDLGQHKLKCRKDAAAFLEERLQVLAKSREPQESDGAVRQATIDRLRALLHVIFPPPSRLQLVPYGSFLSSCYSRGSDLDLALAGEVDVNLLPPPVPGVEPPFPSSTVALESLKEEHWVLLLRRLADALEAQGVARGSVTRILEARVPIIKFVESNSGIECDVCVTTRGCDFKGSIMRLLHGLQPSLAPLIRLVKLWAKQHDINSAHCGTLNSWSLALMALFSMQCHPEGHLLPPLWRLFHDEEPSGPGGAGRPLQDKNMPLAVMLVVATSRCEEEADRLIHPRWTDSEPPPLLDLLLWFLSCFTAITGRWRDSAAHRNWRVSAWLGRGYTSRFPKAYVAAVEEPFDCNDNTARSVGIRERNENTLPYIAWVFGHSVHLLRNISSATDAARALAWLFGPDALACVGMQQLEVKPSAFPAALWLRVEELASRARRPAPGTVAGAAANGTTAPRSSAWAGRQAAASAESESEAEAPERVVGEAEREAAAEVHLAFRALIDATKVGSPIMTLEEWRTQLACSRGRPPHAWHRLYVRPRGAGPDGHHANNNANNHNGNNHNLNLIHLPPPPPPQRHPHPYPHPTQQQLEQGQELGQGQGQGQPPLAFGAEGGHGDAEPFARSKPSYVPSQLPSMLHNLLLLQQHHHQQQQQHQQQGGGLAAGLFGAGGLPPGFGFGAGDDGRQLVAALQAPAGERAGGGGGGGGGSTAPGLGPGGGGGSNSAGLAILQALQAGPAAERATAATALLRAGFSSAGLVTAAAGGGGSGSGTAPPPPPGFGAFRHEPPPATAAAAAAAVPGQGPAAPPGLYPLAGGHGAAPALGGTAQQQQQQQLQLFGRGGGAHAREPSGSDDQQSLAELLRLLAVGGGDGGGGTAMQPSTASAAETAAARQAPYNIFQPPVHQEHEQREPQHQHAPPSSWLGLGQGQGQGQDGLGQPLHGLQLGGLQVGQHLQGPQQQQQQQQPLVAAAAAPSNGHAWPPPSLFGQYPQQQQQPLTFPFLFGTPALTLAGAGQGTAPSTIAAAAVGAAATAAAANGGGLGGPTSAAPTSASLAPIAAAAGAAAAVRGAAAAPSRPPPPGFGAFGAVGSSSQASSFTSGGDAGGAAKVLPLAGGLALGGGTGGAANGFPSVDALGLGLGGAGLGSKLGGSDLVG